MTSKTKKDIGKKWNQKNNAVTAAAEQVANAQRERVRVENDAKNNKCAKMRNRFAQGNPGTWTYGGVPDKLEFKMPARPLTGTGVVCAKVAMGQGLHPQVSTVGHTDGATQWSPDNQVAMPKTASYPAHVEQAMDYIYDDPVGAHYIDAGGDGYVVNEYSSSVPGGVDQQIVVLSVVMTVLACVLCVFLSFCAGGLLGFVFGSLSGRREATKETNDRYDVVDHQIDV